MATELKRRAVVCDIHGIRYDPDLTSGCIRCRRQGLIPHTKPRFVPLLLALLAFTLIAARLVTAILDDRRTAAPEETTITGGAADPRLDPRRYRAEITHIEAALYPDAAVDLFLLANRAATGGENLAVALEAADRGDIASLARAFATDLAGTDLDAHRLQEARDRWFAIRTRHFLPAEWMVEESARPSADPALVSAYQSFASDLKALIEEAAAAEVDESFGIRLDNLETHLPPEPPFNADSALLLGYRALQKALTAARQAAANPGTAASALEEARRELEEISSELIGLSS